MTVFPRTDGQRWEIATAELEVRCRGATLPAGWAGLFPAFVEDKSTTSPPHVLLDVEPILDWENPHWPSPQKSNWWSTRTADGFHVEGPDYSGDFRQDGAVLRGEIVANCAEPSSLAGALRFALNHWLLGRGMMLHASGVLRNGLLWLFAGYSRAGKTTIARELNGGGEPTSVDRVVLLPEGQSVLAYPTPFSDPGSELVRHEPATPEAVVIVEQGERHALHRLEIASAAGILVHHSSWNWQSRAVMETALETAGWMAERVPMYAMTFSRDEGFWPLLEAIQGDNRCCGPRRFV